MRIRRLWHFRGYWYYRIRERVYDVWFRFFGIQCNICDEYYPRRAVRHGACVNCRSAMPLLWVD